MQREHVHDIGARLSGIAGRASSPSHRSSFSHDAERNTDEVGIQTVESDAVTMFVLIWLMRGACVQELPKHGNVL